MDRRLSIMKFPASAALTAALLASAALPAAAEPVFNRVSSFPVAANLPDDKDLVTVTSAEIITASEDGNTLVYSDSPLGGIGFVDITDPKAPKAAGFIAMDGEPTSVSVVEGKVVVAINTSESKTKPSGRLAIVDLVGRSIDMTCDIGGQPDSVAISADHSFAAIAIENERDEELNDGYLPQLPAGNLAIVSLDGGSADCNGIRFVSLTGLADIAPDDPEPEFVDINGLGEIAVTLQENNHIVVIDGKTGDIKNHFSAGSVDLVGIDTKSDGLLSFTENRPGVLREPDALKWLDDDRFVVANEGDYQGGSRSFTIFDKTGRTLHESGASLEHEIARIGHFPDKRAKSKGIEPEGLEAARYGDQSYFFVLSERGSVVAVYKDTGSEPELVQLLPSGISPEGAIAIPGRNLFATANEVDLGAEGGPRSHVMVYELAKGEPDYPMLHSDVVDGAPIGWGALSGLVGDAERPGILYAVNDSFYGNQPTVYTIDANRKPALITTALPITRNGQAAQKLDIEGIALDGKGGFWLASEGDSNKMISHGIYNVDAKGEITTEIGLPVELLAGQVRFGLEGITTVGQGDDQRLWMAVQREWKDDLKGTVKLLSYKPSSKEWGAVRYRLEDTDEGWVGLSEITANGDYLYIVERDNLIGDKAKLKKLFRVAIADMKPAAIGETLPLVAKEEVHDFLGNLKRATNGYVVDKLEGFAFDATGRAFAVTDNDGVDDSSGETLFFPVELNVIN